MKKILLTLFVFLSLTSVKAQTMEGVIVTTGSGEQVFAVSEIKEIAFGDDGMTVVKTDEGTVSFGNAEGWQIRFGQVESTGIAFAVQSGEAAVAKVFDVNGNLVKEARPSDIRLGELPKGIYIIMCNGKSLKVQR